MQSQAEILVGGNKALQREVLNGEGKGECMALLKNIIEAKARAITEFDTLRVEFPRIWKYLLQQASPTGSVQAYLNKYYDNNIARFLEGQSQTLRHRLAAYLEVEEEKSAFSLPSAPELMTRYQSALDNDLYKAMRALRDAQRFRRESIESSAEVVAEADSNAGTMNY